MLGHRYRQSIDTRDGAKVASMTSNFLDINAYLDRIGCSRPVEPTLESLRALHRAHVMAVPFENLDIHVPRKIVLDIDRIYNKIVNERRGGFCYEVNGLFAALLREIGFRVSHLSARVAQADGGRGPEFDHMLVLVELDQPWIADVGAFREPMGLSEERCEVDGRCWRIEQRGDEYVMLRKDHWNDWADNWAFTLQPRRFEEFAGMCHYHQTAPESHFMRNRVCSIATPDGRVTVTNDRLIVTRGGKREEIPIVNRELWARTLSDHFGITLPQPVTS
jgi:N-hydroxyarylamine O-acetyltransferase